LKFQVKLQILIEIAIEITNFNWNFKWNNFTFFEFHLKIHFVCNFTWFVILIEFTLEFHKSSEKSIKITNQTSFFKWNYKQSEFKKSKVVISLEISIKICNFNGNLQH
jgi:hypothetical protein